MIRNIIIAILFIVSIIEFSIIKYLCRNINITKDKEEKIKYFSNFWKSFIIYVIATSIIGLFLSSIIWEKTIGLNEINTWVGIVLGMVALVLGIISLFLSFYNVDQANQTQKDTVQIIGDLQKSMIDRLHELEISMSKKIDESSEKIGKKYTETKDINSNVSKPQNEMATDWGNYNDDKTT